MRKAWILAAVLAAAVSGACSLKNVQEPEKAGGAPAQEEGVSTGREDGRTTALYEAGAAPYDFSETERYVLESFGMYGRSNLFAFRGPQGAASLEVNVYRLNPDGAWEVIGGSGASMGSGGYVISGDGSLEEAEGGVLALEIQEDHSIALHINSLGRVSCETEPIALETEIVGSAVRFLDEFVPMELGQELPVALMLYDSGSRMELPGLEDYFAPEKFSGIDLVQAVTLRFSEEAGDGGRFDEAGNGGVSSEAGDGSRSGKAEAIDIGGEASGEADSSLLLWKNPWSRRIPRPPWRAWHCMTRSPFSGKMRSGSCGFLPRRRGWLTGSWPWMTGAISWFRLCGFRAPEEQGPGRFLTIRCSWGRLRGMCGWTWRTSSISRCGTCGQPGIGWRNMCMSRRQSGF